MATRVEFDAKEAEAEEEGTLGFDGVLLPPPEATRQVVTPLVLQLLTRTTRFLFSSVFASFVGGLVSACFHYSVRGRLKTTNTSWFFESYIFLDY